MCMTLNDFCQLALVLISLAGLTVGCLEQKKMTAPQPRNAVIFMTILRANRLPAGSLFLCLL